MVDKVDRRRFLIASGGALAVAAAAGAGYYFYDARSPPRTSLSTTPPSPTNPTTPVPQTETPSARPLGTARINPFVESGKSLVSIVKGSSEVEIDAMVRKAVTTIGGMNKIVSPGKRVVVKPAILTAS